MKKPSLVELKIRLKEICDLRQVQSLLTWDQETMMPPGGNAARARQLSVVTTISHQKECSPELGKMLGGLRDWADAREEDDVDAALVRTAARDYDLATLLPESFVAEFAQHRAKTWQIWREARKNNDFKTIQPWLEKTLELSLRQANYYKHFEHP